MSSFNKIIIVGFLGRDPELKYTPSGTAVCKFSIATTEKRKKEGEENEVTTWFRCTAWGRQAEVAQEYLAKGSKVYVEGQLRQEEFIDREGGARASLEVTVRELQFLSSKKEGDSQQQETQGNNKREAIKKALGAQAPSKKPSVNDDDEIPF